MTGGQQSNPRGYRCLTEFLTEPEVRKVDEAFTKTYLQEEFKLPFERADVDYLRILDLSLRSLRSLSAFKERKNHIVDKLVDKPEETLTEIVIAGLLARDGFEIVEFEHRYRYDKTLSRSKDLDLLARIDGREMFFEMMTRADIMKRRKSLPGIRGIDNMHLTDIRNKYAKKEIQRANESGFLSNQPVIFVIDTHRSVPQIFFSNAASILRGCEYLTAILMFSGYRLFDDRVLLNQGLIYHNNLSQNRLSQKEQDRLTEIARSWTVDARFDLERLSDSRDEHE